MNPWYGKALFLAALVASIAIRVLALMGVAVMLLPLLYAINVLSFADHALPIWSFALGAGFVALWLWLFYRSHADLGSNWSVSLEVRENHKLITAGIYAHLRHPMYTAIYAHAIAQALLLPNWIAGPATLIAFTLMFALRLGPEERMMREQFGDEYALYAKRTRRLIPGIF